MLGLWMFNQCMHAMSVVENVDQLMLLNSSLKHCYFSTNKFTMPCGITMNNEKATVFFLLKFALSNLYNQFDLWSTLKQLLCYILMFITFWHQKKLSDSLNSMILLWCIFASNWYVLWYKYHCKSCKLCKT